MEDKPFDPRPYVGRVFDVDNRSVLIIEAGFLQDVSRTPYLRYSGLTIVGESKIKWFIDNGKERTHA